MIERHFGWWLRIRLGSYYASLACFMQLPVGFGLLKRLCSGF